MIKLDNPGDWTIRTANSQPNQFISAYAVLSYVDSYSSCYQPTDGLPGLCGNQVYTSPPSDQPKMGFAGNPIDGATTLDSFHLPPYPAVPPIIVADHTVIWDTSQPNDRLWKLDSQPFLAWRDDAQPAIIDPQPFLDADIAVSLNNGSVVDIVFSIPPGQPTHVSTPYPASLMVAVSQARNKVLGVSASLIPRSLLESAKVKDPGCGQMSTLLPKPCLTVSTFTIHPCEVGGRAVKAYARYRSKPRVIWRTHLDRHPLPSAVPFVYLFPLSH